MTKHCSGCNQTLPIESFNKRGTGHQAKCRKCQKVWYKEYYDSNPKEKKRLFVKNKETRDNLKLAIRELKENPCTDCGIAYPFYVMDFDHQFDKNFNVASAVRKNYPISKILEEIDKCELVCSNCHRERTFSHLVDEFDDFDIPM